MSEENETKNNKNRPPVWERTFQEIYEDLRRPIPKRLLREKKLGGRPITFISWHDATRLMDFYCAGWTNEIVRSEIVGGKYIVTVRVTLNCKDGVVFREATGLESEDYDTYGDAASNSSAMALKRCFAYLGLGLELYDK